MTQSPPGRYTCALGWLLLLVTLGATTACQDPLEDDSNDALLASNEAAFTHDEVAVYYLRGAPGGDEPMDEKIIEFDKPVQFMELHLTSEAPTLRFQVQRLDGTWTEEDAFQMHYAEAPNFGSRISFQEPIIALHVTHMGESSFVRIAAGPHAFDAHGDHLRDESVTPADVGGEVQTADQALSRSGRWAIPSATLAQGRQQKVPYTYAGSRCSGSSTPGALELGRYLVANFSATHYQVYNCRSTTPGGNLSLHAVGRAIDLFVPLHRGAADNDKGDPVGRWLIENARHIGIQYIIWDRTQWLGINGKGSYYSGSHPHHDHLHIELTPQAGAKRTAFFTKGPPGKPTPGGGQRGCASNTLGREVTHGACVQMPYASGCGAKCRWAACNAGSWVCKSGPSCAWAKGKNHPHKSCATAPVTKPPVAKPPAKPPEKPPVAKPPAAEKKKCASNTLGRAIWHGGCVQMPYASGCGGKCRWAACNDGKWVCRKGPTCAWGEGKNHPHKACK